MLPNWYLLLLNDACVYTGLSGDILIPQLDWSPKLIKMQAPWPIFYTEDRVREKKKVLKQASLATSIVF